MHILSYYFSDDGPGAALAVVTDGRAPVIECIGSADIARHMAITTDTVFELASASKVFTATAAMLLAERGRLDLRAPAGEYLTECENPRAGRPITVNDLLRHTSGLADYLKLGIHTPPSLMTRTHIMAELPRWSRAALPGREHRYSNTNYVVLARVIEAVAGIDFARFVESHLAIPFGLHSTRVDPTGRATRLGRAQGYRDTGCGLPHVETSEGLAIDTDGDGGMVSSLNDLVRWQSLFWSGAIVGERSLRLMQTLGELDSGERFAYGLGLQIEHRSNGRQWCGHGGSWTNATTLIGRYVGERTNVIVLSNEFMAPVERISQRALAAAGVKAGTDTPDPKGHSDMYNK